MPPRRPRPSVGQTSEVLKQRDARLRPKAPAGAARPGYRCSSQPGVSRATTGLLVVHGWRTETIAENSGAIPNRIPARDARCIHRRAPPATGKAQARRARARRTARRRRRRNRPGRQRGRRDEHERDRRDHRGAGVDVRDARDAVTHRDVQQPEEQAGHAREENAGHRIGAVEPGASGYARRRERRVRLPRDVRPVGSVQR
jgi:hypothetical protein